MSSNDFNPLIGSAELGTRWVAFVRHAQAGHNVDPDLIMNPDNPLTDEGWEASN